MWEDADERAKIFARYIIETGCTVRACAKHFSCGKSTVHKDVSERLKYIDQALFRRTRKVLDKNLRERHIRGGIATKMKYLKERKKSQSAEP